MLTYLKLKCFLKYFYFQKVWSINIKGVYLEFTNRFEARYKNIKVQYFNDIPKIVMIKKTKF